jgi:hypothetical protein
MIDDFEVSGELSTGSTVTNVLQHLVEARLEQDVSLWEGQFGRVAMALSFLKIIRNEVSPDVGSVKRGSRVDSRQNLPSVEALQDGAPPLHYGAPVPEHQLHSLRAHRYDYVGQAALDAL